MRSKTLEGLQNRWRRLCSTFARRTPWARRLNLWTPPKPRLWEGESLDDVVESYRRWLEVCAPEHKRAFDGRLKSDDLAAKAEAATFAWLRQARLSPTLAEDASKGGPDFMCSPTQYPPFVVEVTTISKKALERKSGFPETLVNGAANTFSMITRSLFGRAQKKTSQLAGQEVAGVLLVCASHVGADILLSTLAAELLMASDTQIAVPIGHAAPVEVTQVTYLKNSVFFKVDKGKIVAARRTISAILLMSISHNESRILGLLHPDPEVAFDYHCLPGVPFLRVVWPIADDGIETYWVIADPEEAREDHTLVELSDDELRGR